MKFRYVLLTFFVLCGVFSAQAQSLVIYDARDLFPKDAWSPACKAVFTEEYYYSQEWQVIYVGVFLRLLYATYGSVNKKGEHTQEGLETLSVYDQVRLAATAYNRGVVWAAPGYGDLSALREHVKEKHFHYALIPSKRTKRYCYATLALKHYKKIAR